MAWTMYGEYFRCADCDPLPDLLLQRHSIPPEPPQQETMFP